MLVAEWEPLAEQIVNTPDLMTFLVDLDKPEQREKYGFHRSIFDIVPNAQASFGMDTRHTSPILKSLATQACNLIGVRHVDFGLCTTPQLHWLLQQKMNTPSDTKKYVNHFK